MVVMLESVLHLLIPAHVDTFAKLRGGDPYHFDHWETDPSGSKNLKYWFWNRKKSNKNRKRAPVSEIRIALGHVRNAGVFKQETYQAICPVASADGPCGFAVIGRTFEALSVARYAGHGAGFRLINADEATRLLEPAHNPGPHQIEEALANYLARWLEEHERQGSA